jgi:hypothetical protein
VWVRGLSANSDYDSCHVGLDGNARDESFAQRFTVGPTFEWASDTRGQGPQTVNVTTPGVHLLSVWIRESGQIVDKVLMTTDAGLTPSGAGPAQSALVPVGASGPFIRGDANRSGTLDISDGLAILFKLFAGGTALRCEDHGDVDDNGALQVTDAVRLLDYLFQGGAAPAAPFPSAGQDPTGSDPFDCGD